MDLYETNGSSPPALRRVLNNFEGNFRFTSIRVEDPSEFEPLPLRFTLRRKAGVWWLVDSHAPRVVRARWDGGRS